MKFNIYLPYSLLSYLGGITADATADDSFDEDNILPLAKDRKRHIKNQRDGDAIKNVNIPREDSFTPQYHSHPDFGECNLTSFKIDNESPLGKGAYGETFLATHRPTGRKMVLKKYFNNAIIEEAEQLRVEEYFQHTLDHPNIAKIYCTIEEVESQSHTKVRSIYFVMDYYSGGDLWDRMTADKISSKQAHAYTAQLLSVLRYLHQLGIAHLDIKPPNILVDDTTDTIKLIDFGLCIQDTSPSGPQIKRFAGTPEYMAPEIYLGHPYGASADLWAAGICVYNIFMGKLPFKAVYGKKSGKKFFLEAQTEKLIPTTGKKEVDILIRRLCTMDPKERLKKIYDQWDEVRRLEFFRGTMLNSKSSKLHYIIWLGIGIGVMILMMSLVFCFRRRKRTVKDLKQ